MSELIKSIEKSVSFLKVRYPDGHALLTCLEEQLEDLKARKGKTAQTKTAIEQLKD